MTAGPSGALPLGLTKGFAPGSSQEVFSAPWTALLGMGFMHWLSHDLLMFFPIPLKRHLSKI